MSEIVDAQIAEYCQYGNNPEGFPVCPKCGEFVWFDEDVGDERALETSNYTCGECGFVFPIGEAV